MSEIGVVHMESVWEGHHNWEEFVNIIKRCLVPFPGLGLVGLVVHKRHFQEPQSFLIFCSASQRNAAQKRLRQLTCKCLGSEGGFCSEFYLFLKAVKKLRPK